MKYMIMMNAPFGSGDHEIFSWKPEAIQAHVAYWNQLNQELKDAGEWVQLEALTAPKQAKLVRAGKDGRPVTDGPFAESKEFLAGFWIVEVASPERAYQLAARVSRAPGPDGAPLYMPVEVRQVLSGPPA